MIEHEKFWIKRNHKTPNHLLLMTNRRISWSGTKLVDIKKKSLALYYEMNELLLIVGSIICSDDYHLVHGDSDSSPWDKRGIIYIGESSVFPWITMVDMNLFTWLYLNIWKKIHYLNKVTIVFDLIITIAISFIIIILLSSIKVEYILIFPCKSCSCLSPSVVISTLSN